MFKIDNLDTDNFYTRTVTSSANPEIGEYPHSTNDIVVDLLLDNTHSVPVIMDPGCFISPTHYDTIHTYLTFSVVTAVDIYRDADLRYLQRNERIS